MAGAIKSLDVKLMAAKIHLKTDDDADVDDAGRTTQHFVISAERGATSAQNCVCL